MSVLLSFGPMNQAHTAGRRTSCLWKLRQVLAGRVLRGKKKPRASECAGFKRLLDIPHGSLAVFYVEQVALNRHDMNVKEKRGTLIA